MNMKPVIPTHLLRLKTICTTSIDTLQVGLYFEGEDTVAIGPHTRLDRILQLVRTRVEKGYTEIVSISSFSDICLVNHDILTFANSTLSSMVHCVTDIVTGVNYATIFFVFRRPREARLLRESRFECQKLLKWVISTNKSNIEEYDGYQKILCKTYFFSSK